MLAWAIDKIKYAKKWQKQKILPSDSKDKNYKKNAFCKSSSIAEASWVAK